MGLLDRFGGPEAWDRRCEMEEGAYMERIEGRSCMECAHSVECPYEGMHDVGWCLMAGEFVRAEDTPADRECGEFE